MLEGPVTRQLFTLSLPMIAGVFSLNALSVADTYFIARLGIDSLAAFGFTFPVVMGVGAVAIGLGIGASAVISRAIGRGDTSRVRILARDSLLLAVVIVSVFAVGGLLTIDPLFRLLGATDELLPLIRSYMEVYYSCVAVMILTMIGNHCLRATGNTVSSGILMVFLSVLNIALDPLLIFGWWGFPALGISGAAWAAVFSRLITVAFSLYLMIFRCRIVAFSLPRPRELLASWREILKTAAPSAGTHFMMPLTAGVVTALVAGYGAQTVAAVGAAGRIIGFSFIIPVALGLVLVPFIGQNWGAGSMRRSRKALFASYRFSLYYSGATLLLFLVFCTSVCKLFSDDAMVIWIMTAYTAIRLATSTAVHIAVHSEFALNAAGFPFQAMGLNLARNLVLTCSLAWFGEALAGLWGLFGGLALSDLIAGAVAFGWLNRLFGRTPASEQAKTEKILIEETYS